MAKSKYLACYDILKNISLSVILIVVAAIGLMCYMKLNITLISTAMAIGFMVVGIQLGVIFLMRMFSKNTDIKLKSTDLIPFFIVIIISSIVACRMLAIQFGIYSIIFKIICDWVVCCIEIGFVFAEIQIAVGVCLQFGIELK